MAVEIKEVIIRAVLEDPEEGQDAGTPTADANADMNPDDIVQACVEQVLRILKRRNYR
ncbi:MAG: DUF5908 family protein [Bacteroidota bacterium]